GQQRDRLELVARPVAGAPPDRAVGEEDRVELGGLRAAGDVLVEGDVADALRAAVGVAPRGLVVAGVVDERVEGELSGHVGFLGCGGSDDQAAEATAATGV